MAQKPQATFYLDLEKSLATPGLTRKLELLIKKKMCISMTDPPGFSLFELVDPLILEIMTPRFIKPPQCGEYGLLLSQKISRPENFAIFANDP